MCLPNVLGAHRGRTHISHRDAFREMLESVSQNGHTFEECKQLLQESKHSVRRGSASLSEPSFRHQARFWFQRVLPILQIARYTRHHRVEVWERRSFLSHPRGVDPVNYPCSGMEPLIRAILSNLVGDDANNIEIISNSVDVHKDGSWSIKFRHPSRYCVPSFPQLALAF